MPSRKVVREDDGRIRANRPPSTRPTKPKSRNQQLMDGDISVEDLDDDEVLMGRCKAKDGTFGGRPPKAYSRKLLDALRAEFKRRTDEKFQAGTDLALQTLMDVMASPVAAGPARVRAAEVWLERTIGKVPEKMEATVEMKPYEDVEGLLVDVVPGEVLSLQDRMEDRRGA